ncbi:MAG: geranylgeranylglyceryl/heptaprenylglyceryl phosphate synthase [Bacteroidota bacterium]
MIYSSIKENISNRKLFMLLIDPENYPSIVLDELADMAAESGVDYFLVGGSLVSNFMHDYIEEIKEKTSIPVILFPGSLLQLSGEADAILFLSLISGRNPEFLIGNHVLAAPYLKKKKIEVIPTGYILINGGNTSSVEYISNTRTIPVTKPDIITATAIAGEMLGHKLIYLESGSGAIEPGNEEIIKVIKNNITVPLIVGGGITNGNEMQKAYKAGADIVVVGNSVEKDINHLQEFQKVPRDLTYYK